MSACLPAHAVPRRAYIHDAGAVPDPTQMKDISLESLKGKYTVLFFYPLDFTFVCPTEIVAFSDRIKDFKDINCQVIARGVGVGGQIDPCNHTLSTPTRRGTLTQE